jgi:hypothetical protein
MDRLYTLMSHSIGVSGSYKTIASSAVGVGGEWKTVQQRYAGVSGAWKKFYDSGSGPPPSDLSVSVDITLIEGVCDNAVYGPATVTASGGTAPYTYLWVYVSGNAGIHCQDETLRTGSFYGASNGAFGRNAIWRCKVSDSASGISYCDNVTIDLIANV